jgi:hypothetical protein
LLRWGHASRVTPQEKQKLFDEKLNAAPLCKCGCGQKVKSAYTTAEIWAKNKYQPFYRDFCDGHVKCTIDQTTELSSLENQAILGTLLGDTSIGYAHKNAREPRLSSTHGLIQKEWAEYKAAYLLRLGFSTRVIANAGYGEKSVCSASKCLPALREIYTITHPFTNKKTVTVKWLDQIGDIGLAWWFCDDGTACGRSVFFHTEGYSRHENHTIAQWFCDTIGKATVVNNHKKRLCFISISSSAQCALKRIIEPHVPDCMQYKLDAIDIHRSRRKAKSI